SVKSSFPSRKYADYQVYAKLLLPHIKTEYQIKNESYYNISHDNVTETQYKNLQEHITKRRQKWAIVDVVILSKASNAQLKAMTQKAINTCIAGANQLPVNVIVIEQMPHVQYDNAQTVFHHTDVFNYNDNMNLGARQGKAKHILFCNSDLL